MIIDPSPEPLAKSPFDKTVSELTPPEWPVNVLMNESLFGLHVIVELSLFLIKEFNTCTLSPLKKFIINFNSNS